MKTPHTPTQMNIVDHTSGETTEMIRKQAREALAFANANPVVLSCLYDLDLMPEQVEEGSKKWCEMMVIITHFHQAIETKTKWQEHATNCHDELLAALEEVVHGAIPHKRDFLITPYALNLVKAAIQKAEDAK